MADTYCEADDVKQWLGVDDVNLDWIADLAISSASRWVDGFCHRPFSLSAEASARYFDAGRDGTVWTDDIGAVDVAFELATDTAGDGTYASVWTDTDYQLLPLNAPNGPEPQPYWQIAPTGTGLYGFTSGYRKGGVRVTAKWGWPAVPDPVKQATIMQAARIVKRRTSPEGVAGFSDFGAVRVSNTDRDVEALLQPYVLMSVA